MDILYTSKEDAYFKHVRKDLISLIPTQVKNISIFELGAATGNTLVELKNLGLAKEVVGMDITVIEKSNQTNPIIDKFIIGNIETDDLEIPDNYFDIILAGDVLEHLIDPWSVVEKITCKLKKGGLLIVSLPNIQEITTMYKIFIAGDFKYSHDGILDKTHMRFFCKKNACDLLNTDFLKLEKVIPSIEIRKTQRSFFNKITFGLFHRYLTTQYLLVAVKI